MKRKSAPSVFSLASPFRDPMRQTLFKMFSGSLERMLMLDQLNRIYESIGALPLDHGDFLARAMRVLNVNYRVSDEDRARIPATGPVVVVANHPFGGIEGIVLLRLLRQVRPDAKVMANYILGRMPEMDEFSIYVNPFGGTNAARANIQPLKECLRWVRQGHLLLVFPSGEVSHLRLNRREVADPEWSPTIAGIIRRTGAPALPVFIEGRNSAFFQMLGLLHARFRTALLPRELINKQGTSLRFRIGTPIPHERLAKIAGDREMMSFLRLRTYIQMSRNGDIPTPARRRGVRLRRPIPRKSVLPVAAPLYPELIHQDICLLAPDQTLLESGDYAVYLARGTQIPRLLHEIGRRREITFREEGEGTGRALDLDRFDEYYHHLILWSRKNRELVGAYRVGKTDEILAHHGIKGLYTSTLFRYRKQLLTRLGPSLELGRSFIRKEYQRNYSTLLLLWKGIGAIIAREPKYRNLFGPVSINNEYNTVSRQMMEAFLRANNFDPACARFVRPRNPTARRPGRRWDPRIFRHAITSPDEMSDLLAEIERDQKGVPILLKQYLKMGGKLLGFNVDPEFSDVLDGLIWVDMCEADSKLVERYLGRDGAAALYAYHHIPPR